MEYKNIHTLIAQKCECKLIRERIHYGNKEIEYTTCWRCKRLQEYIDAIKREINKNLQK